MHVAGAPAALAHAWLQAAFLAAWEDGGAALVRLLPQELEGQEVPGLVCTDTVRLINGLVFTPTRDRAAHRAVKQRLWVT